MLWSWICVAIRVLKQCWKCWVSNAYYYCWFHFQSYYLCGLVTIIFACWFSLDCCIGWTITYHIAFITLYFIGPLSMMLLHYIIIQHSINDHKNAFTNLCDYNYDCYCYFCWDCYCYHYDIWKINIMLYLSYPFSDINIQYSNINLINVYLFNPALIFFFFFFYHSIQ